MPLRRFPASRHADSDARGLYFMPTAIGDDYFDGTSSPERVRRHFQSARELGVKYLRCAFSWDAIEKTPGTYDWTFWDGVVADAEGSGIELIPYVAYTPEWAAREPKEYWKQPPRDPQIYANFMKQIAARYKGRVRSWEIWNEPDNKDYWTGTADEFAELVKRAAEGIREADPEAVLVLGGMANGPSRFFRTLIESEHLDRYVDVVAVHAYPETWGNERAEFVFQKQIPEMQQMVAADRSGDDLWLNEMGYADYRFSREKASVYGTSVFYRYEHTRQYQAQMLFKFFVMALATQKLSLAGWYRIDDFPLAEKRLGSDLVNFHLGVVDERGKPKPSFLALKFFNRLFGDPSRLVDAHAQNPQQSQSVVNVFRVKDGRTIVVGWLRSSERSEVRGKPGMLKDRRSETVAVALPCASAKALGYYDVEGKRTGAQARLHAGSLENIRLRGDRVFIGEFACGPTQVRPRQGQ